MFSYIMKGYLLYLIYPIIEILYSAYLWLKGIFIYFTPNFIVQTLIAFKYWFVEFIECLYIVITNKTP